MNLQKFLNEFSPKLQQKSKQVNQAAWLLETTGSKDAALLKAELETELRLLLNDKPLFDQLVAWDQDLSIKDPLQKRQLNVLIRMFKPNLIAKELLRKIAQEEAHLAFLYSNFRPLLNGKSVSENEIREILKQETHVEKRKEAWEASKQIGKVLAPHILKLVQLRNESAHSLGYSNYFSMQLSLQEVDENWLFETLDSLAIASEQAYMHTIEEICASMSERFKVAKEDLGPWAWVEPFCQEDPLDAKNLDTLVAGVDILKTSKEFYNALHFNVTEILERSDNFERPGKNQHAFCIHMDREGDVRTLNNVQATSKWLETVLHELGHAVYELGFAPQLPWLLKEPPHMITTEAMALLMGRQAYRSKSLEQLALHSPKNLRERAEVSLKRRQLIFSRWVLVMTYFERELYRDPHQNLNALWWNIIEKFQKIKSSGSASQNDWAAKYHIGLAPVYYFSYLLGELFASSLEEKLQTLPPQEAGLFFKKKLFEPGNSIPWNALIAQSTGKQLSSEAWIRQFA
jgi:peptidyl-dipeptidase A